MRCVGLGAAVGGGSLGDRGLSGRADDERANLEETLDRDDTAAESIAAEGNSDAGIVDLGRSASVIDSTRDPSAGLLTRTTAWTNRPA
jgi:hypothetical protein